MRKPRSGFSVSVLLLIVSLVLGAGSASAAQRAVLCEAGGTQFSDAHCTTAGTGFGHISITDGVATAVSLSNARTAAGTTAAAPMSLEGTLAGIDTKIECSTVGGSGSLTNSATFVSGSGTIVFSGCSVTKPPNQKCVVTNGAFETETVSATTESQAKNNVKFSAAKFIRNGGIAISQCETAALNNTFPVTGSFIATASGATLTTTLAGITSQNTLKWGGNKAGLEGALTINKSATTIAISLT